MKPIDDLEDKMVDCSRSQDEMRLVGFFDILGTRESVMSNHFSDVDVVEFVNPIGLAAGFTPTVRFAVFSDSLIVSTESSEIKPLLRAINFMYLNWFSELVHVRSAISYGEVRWVDDPHSDKLFEGCRNLTYARIYGKGLVAAHELEQHSGPGAICFLTNGSAELFRREEPNSVLDSYAPMLCWATEQEAKKLEGHVNLLLERAEKDTPEWRHLTATKQYWTMVVANRKFQLNNYSLHSRTNEV
jgi:hypothetical protein